MLIKDYDPLTGQPVYRERIDRPKEAYATAERDALTGSALWTGRVIYNTTTGALEVYNGSAWVSIAQPGAWTAWTPAITQGVAVTSTTTMAGYVRNGRIIHANFKLAATSNGTAGSVIAMSLPVAPKVPGAGTTMTIGTAYMSLAGTGQLNALVTVSPAFGAIAVFLRSDIAAYTNYVGTDPSVTFSSTNEIGGSVTYEAAS